MKGLNTFFAIVFFLAMSMTTQAQLDLTWEDMTDIEFEEKYYEEEDAYYLFPKFGENIKLVDNVQVSVAGYVIPLDPEGGIYMLSKVPNSSCFFCGGAGPETVVELQFADEDHRRYMTDERIVFTGTFVLNDTDTQHCNYILRSARETGKF